MKRLSETPLSELQPRPQEIEWPSKSQAQTVYSKQNSEERYRRIKEVLGLTGRCMGPGCKKNSVWMWLTMEACSLHRYLVEEHMKAMPQLSDELNRKLREAGIVGKLPYWAGNRLIRAVPYRLGKAGC